MSKRFYNRSFSEQNNNNEDNYTTCILFDHVFLGGI